MAEFKIGRLRFTWKGQWATGTFYNRDAVSQYNGKTYVCLEPHTSGDFYDDIAHVNEAGASTPYWTLMLEGKEWKQAWEPTTFYSLGNIVTYGGVVYVCTEQHTSGSAQIDLTKWDTYSRFDNWNNAWATASVYGVGDIVKYGGIVYRCTVNHLSNASASAGLEADQSKWEVVNNGIDYKVNFATSTRYKKNDLVKNGADLYICLEGHTASTFDVTKWATWLPGLDFGTTWNTGATYQVGDLVIYGGYSYVSTSSNNTANIPSTSTSNWKIVTEGYSMKSDWDSGSSYKIGDVVRRGGLLFVAASDNTNKDPSGFSVSTTYTATGSTGTTLKVASTVGIVPGMIVHGVGYLRGQTVVSVFDSNTVIISEVADGTAVNGQAISFIGVNYVFWTLVVPSVNWKNFWATNIDYVIGDIAIWGNATYRCVNNHTSGDVFRPDLDTDRQYWIDYILHARENAGNSQGDLVAFNGTAPAAIPIGPEDYVLRVNTDLPAWAKILKVNKVFYVATDGVDADGYGDTLDKPYASVKYAATKVLNGTEFQNTNALLKANKEWLVEELYQWMVYQSANNNPPFSTTSVFDEAASKRDARLIIDAISYDMSRTGNSQIVAATIRYFADGSTTTFFNDATDAAQDYIVASLVKLKELMNAVFENDAPAFNYQELNYAWDSGTTYATDDVVFFAGNYYISLLDNNADSQPDVSEAWALTTVPASIVDQTFDLVNLPEGESVAEMSSLMDIVITAITNANTATVPQPNQGITSTIFVKTGTYSEDLPIVLPENCALVGDELRGTVIQPKKTVYTYTTSSKSSNNRFTLHSTDGLEVGMPIQFVSAGINDEFSEIILGQTFYVLEIAGKEITVSTAVGGSEYQLVTGTGFMTVYAGDCLKDMIYVRNGSGIRNMTLTGLAGTLTDLNINLTRRPTGGAYVSLDPGTGPDDTTVWILKRSPYIQNVTNFGVGCTGLKIDGTLHNGGNKSIVCNDFTQIISDGIGVWCTGTGSLTECVSVFSYYNYAGYLAEDGGRIRATNGNSSYGVYGCIAEGFDDTEVPIAGLIDNRSSQVQASVQSSFGVSAQLLKMQYANAGSGYNESTTNMLKNSNHLDETASWTSDGNLTIQQNVTSPSGYADGWTLTGNTSTTDSSYLYQDLTVAPPGATYTALPGLNVTGSGIGADFDVTVNSTSYAVTVNGGGSGYVIGNQIRILGSALGGLDGTNDCFVTVATLSGSSILTVTVTGTVPEGSALPYTFSIYAKQGSATAFDVYATYSGTATMTSSINYNFVTGNFTPASSGGGLTPTSYGKLELPNGWYRIWFTFYDKNALNNALQIRLYPRGRAAPAGSTRFYGSQLQISSSPTFYLETTDNRHTAFANYRIVGAGTGAETIGDELRTGAVFQTRVTDEGSGLGGAGYLTAQNNAQGGDDASVTLSGSDTNLANNYIGMRVFLNSGTGAGQYGYISAYDDGVSKIAQVLKESFAPLSIVGSDSLLDELSLSPSFNTNTLYENQRVQFIPTYYNTTVSSTGVDSVTVTASTGGIINTLTVSSTKKLTANMPIKFFGTTFGGVVTDFTYYIKEIIDDVTITISTEIFGAVWLLTTSSGSFTMTFPGYNSYISASTANMQVNMPVQFTGSSLGGISVGTTYYINDIVNASTFTISSTLVEIEATASNASTNALTTSSTASLVPLNPIVFSGVTFGNIVAGTTYYINKIVSPGAFTLTSSIISVQASATEITSNLITVNNTAGFIANNPIVFTGNTFGGIVNGTTYYILAINNETTFTISTSPGGSAFNLTTATGDMLTRTTDGPVVLSTDTGSMTGSTTNAKTSLAYGFGAMNATFSTKLFGNVVAGTTYYVRTINASSFTISETSGGADFALKTDAGAMNVAAVGWDHINPGTPIADNLDSSTVYFIEARTIYSPPPFLQTATTINAIAPGTSWISVGYGAGTFMALPSGNATGGMSVNGTDWTAFTLPEMRDWVGIAYGNEYWVALSTNGSMTESFSKVAVSNSNGAGWRMFNLPAKTTWSNIAYGNGKFVAIATASSTSAYSNTFGSSWSAGTGLPNTAWTGLTYGKGIFVAVASGGTTAAYTTTGATWTSATLPASTTWSSVAFGNNLFVAVSNTSSPSAYSQDGQTWYAGNISITADKIAYGQGVFVAVDSNSGTAYTSEDGEHWIIQTVTDDSYGAITFGYIAEDDYVGKFITVAGQSTGSIISAGARAKGRAVITSGKIRSVSQWEAGSGYTTAPTLTFTDPNVTNLVTVDMRLSNGTLGNPTFVNRGQDYNTNSTAITITGGGYADTFQVGLTLIVKNLTSLPRPGDNLVIEGNTKVYKVTNASAVFGTTAPNIQANIQTSPEMTTALSPNHEAAVTIRQKYSQCRLTGHDFLNVGYGNYVDSRYPGVPTDTVLAPQDQAVEVNFGRVFYTSTDQDGNFKVGSLFAVEQATGIVTLSASQFGLSGLETLSLGGIAVGGSSVVVRQFSTDSSFVANSNEIIPTQRAVKAYLESRLSQGGSNTFTGQLIAGTVLIGGADKIASTIPNGIAGSVVRMPNVVRVEGEFAGWDGDGMAYQFFMKNANNR
jgi:hypothetical protein